ncbi:MAG: EscU/YscU/HrcU family type III secretion system export apparatus switch protein [Rhodobiaceae bacterium]|nr:EscU/YscU/HrcU family type III secretion system export apparatus switch protein [Rhodobiaceae bacterium]
MSGKNDTGKHDVAVALGYDHGTGEAPRVLAKGRGAVAERIIESAQEHGVHVEENPILAEALSQVELDDKIPEDLYRAVAEVISFVLYQTRNKR